MGICGVVYMSWWLPWVVPPLTVPVLVLVLVPGRGPWLVCCFVCMYSMLACATHVLVWRVHVDWVLYIQLSPLMVLVVVVNVHGTLTIEW